MTCPHCRTRAAAEYLARGRRRALGHVFGVLLGRLVLGGVLGLCASGAVVLSMGWHHV